VLLIAAMLSACSPEVRQAAGGAVLDVAITDLGVAAGLALRDAID